MKIEIDFVEAIDIKPVKEIKMKNGKVYFQHQLNIKQKNYTTSIISKSYNRELIKSGVVDPKKEKSSKKEK